MPLNLDLGAIPNSTAPAVRAYLFEALTQYLTPDPLNADAGLLVCYDDPGPYQPEDVIAIGEVMRAFEPGSFVGNGGAGYLRERYTVAIVLDVYRGGDDALTVYTRAQLLADTIVAIVRADLSLGGNVLKADLHSDSGHGEWDPEHKGRHWLSEVVVSAYAQI